MNELDSIMVGDSGVAADTSQLETETKPEAKVSTRKATVKPKAAHVVDDEVPALEVARDRTDNEIVMEQNDLMRGAKRIKIRLEQNKEIPPSGQFIGRCGEDRLRRTENLQQVNDPLDSQSRNQRERNIIDGHRAIFVTFSLSRAQSRTYSGFVEA